LIWLKIFCNSFAKANASSRVSEAVISNSFIDGNIEQILRDYAEFLGNDDQVQMELVFDIAFSSRRYANGTSEADR
jgi:hypothetical protein